MDSVKDYITPTNKMRTICEVIRECNDLLLDHEDSDDIPFHYEKMRNRLREIHNMAKRMNGKLIEYKKDYDNSMGVENHNYEKNKALREKRRIVR